MERASSAWPIWVDGGWCDPHRPVARADDAGLLYGHGAFETVRLYQGRPVALERHLTRLATSLHALGIDAALEGIGTAVDHLARRVSAAEEAAARIVVTAGSAAGRPLRIVSARPLPASVRARRCGAPAVGVEGLLRSPATHKSLAWLPSLLARAQVPPGTEPVFTTPAGELLEGATTNLFVREGDGWLTPPADRCLPGVTRALVIVAARRLGQTVRETPIHRSRLCAGAEAFLTNALLPLAPLTAFDGVALAPPSTLQQALRAGYDEVAHAD